MPEQPPRVHVQTPGPNGDRLQQLREIVPEAFSEGRIDFARLREALGDLADDSPERYTFSWAGKRDAIRLLQMPTRAALIPDPEQSVDWDATGNVFIEGENLEVLKLLLKPYHGRVKMIYIDPPYNTGNDFIYSDDYRDPLGAYLEETKQVARQGGESHRNQITSGRKHSAWLSMMYPRLWLARQLLREDGVIFVSIDDNEVHNLRVLMNEVFGEENFVGALIWKRRQNVDSRAKTGISADHEYAMVYSRTEYGRLRGQEKDLTKYSNPDDDPRGPWLSADLTGLATADQRPNLHYALVNPETGVAYACPPNGWRYHRPTMERLISEGRIIWPPVPTGRPRFKRYQYELTDEFTGLSTVLSTVYNTQGTRELHDLLDGREGIDFPKPSEYVKLLTRQATNDRDLVLDFFAGSCTTAQAVLELNRDDGGSRRFIMVQIPEVLAAPQTLEDGTVLTSIADIGRERIRRVIARMKEQATEEQGTLVLSERETPEDLGFKAYRLAESSFRPWQGVDAENTENLEEEYARQMELYADGLVEKWVPENVIAEVALKEAGFGLNYRAEAIEGREHLWRVTDPENGRSFYLSLADRVTLEDFEGLNVTPETLVICRATALTDTAASNLELQCRLRVV